MNDVLTIEGETNMGHENGGWMNDDQKEAMKERAAIEKKQTRCPHKAADGRGWMQVWAIVLAETGGTLLSPIDDDGCECFMAFPSESDAIKALESQTAKGWIPEGGGQVQRIA